ncbi:MAG: hypothetical protein ACLU0O_13475, partial [Collinsella sp.]
MPRPDETAVFLMAAQGKSTPQSAPVARSAKPAAHDDDEPLLSDDEWSPLGSTDPVEGVAIDSDDDWDPLSFSARTVAAKEVDTVFGDHAIFDDDAVSGNNMPNSDDAAPVDDAVLVDDPFAMIGSFAVVDDLLPQDEVHEDSQDDVDDMGSSDYSTVGRSAGLMTVLTIVSRVTGFIRTWA